MMIKMRRATLVDLSAYILPLTFKKYTLSVALLRVDNESWSRRQQLNYGK